MSGARAVLVNTSMELVKEVLNDYVYTPCRVAPAAFAEKVIADEQNVRESLQVIVAVFESEIFKETVSRLPSYMVNCPQPPQTDTYQRNVKALLDIFVFMPCNNGDFNFLFTHQGWVYSQVRKWLAEMERNTYDWCQQEHKAYNSTHKNSVPIIACVGNPDGSNYRVVPLPNKGSIANSFAIVDARRADTGRA